MNVSAIELPKEAAKQKYKEYLEASKRIKSKEYSAARRAYRALSKGLKVIDIWAAFEKTGVKADGSGPKLAIVRADAKEVLFIKGRDGSGRFCIPADRSWNQRETASDVQLPAGTFPNWPTSAPNKTWDIVDQQIVTNVPFVPAHIVMPGKPENYYILFEVNKWFRRQKVRDPYLLQRLSNNTFVVLAEWDVSPVEAIVMRAS
jgi:hypothetical protein